MWYQVGLLFFNKMLVLTFCTNFVLNISLLWEEMSKIWSNNYIGLRLKYQFFLSDFNVPSGRTEGLTDMTKLIVAFRNSANAPKKIRYAISFNSCDFAIIRYSKSHTLLRESKKNSPVLYSHIFPIWIGLSIRDLRITLFIVWEFRENWFPRRAHFSCSGKWSHIFSRIAKVNVPLPRQRAKHFNPLIFILYLCVCGQGSSVGMATDFGLDGPESNAGEDEIFCPYRPALGPNQPPVQWVPCLYRG